MRTESEHIRRRWGLRNSAATPTAAMELRLGAWFLIAACAMSLILSAPRSIPGADNPAAPEVQHHLPGMSSIFPQGSERGATVHVQVLGEYSRTTTIWSRSGATVS